jgi:hypothetical protein
LELVDEPNVGCKRKRVSKWDTMVWSVKQEQSYYFIGWWTSWKEEVLWGLSDAEF